MAKFSALIHVKRISSFGIRPTEDAGKLAWQKIG
jgi:hypothetical protein